MTYTTELAYWLLAVIVLGTLAGLISIQRGRVKARKLARAKAVHPAGKGRA